MPRKRICSLPFLLFALFLAAGAAAAAAVPPGAEVDHGIQTFRFIHLSDAHVRPGETAEKMRRTLADIASLDPVPEFVIDTGDATEMGSPEEILLYRETITESTVPVYTVPGNHDSRWSGVGKETFREQIGPPYRGFDHGGVHFVLLDSSLLLEQYGHFDRNQLEWLERDLASLPKGSPVVAALHHPVAIDRRFIDNEWDLLEILSRHNTVLALEGHVHSIRNWRLNGTTHVTSGAVMSAESVYGIFDVSADGIRIAARNVDTKTEEEVLRTGLRNETVPLLEKILAPANVSISNELITITIPNNSGLIPREVIVQVNKRAPVTAKREGTTWTLPLDPGALPEGRSTVVINAIVGEGERLALDGERIARAFEWESPGYGGTVQASVETGGGIQSWPAVADGRVYFGSNDGLVRCHSAGDLLPVWEFQTGAEILSMPVVDGNTVFVGSCDGNMYALDAETGVEKWRFEAGEAIYSTVAADEERIYFGCGDNRLYALDRASGNPVWEFPCESFTKNRPALAGDRVYFGNWDRRVRCVDRQSGELVWEQEVTNHRLFPCATSNPLPVNSALIVATHDYNVRALSLETGEELWFHGKTDTAKPSYSSPALYGNTVLFGSITGHVLGLDAVTGTRVFTTRVNKSGDALFDSSPCVVEDKFYCGSVGGYVYEADAKSGEITWRFRLSPANIFSTPASDGEYLYVGSMDGRLYALTLPE